MAFLGSTIGNMVPAERALFLRRVRSRLRPGDSFLLGTDLVKDPAVLVAAYDDSAGVTAAFNKNVLAVLNAELGADFDLDAFEHIARWDAGHEWIEMRLRSTADQRARVRDLGLVVPFAAGEEMRTEVSAKFRARGRRRPSSPRPASPCDRGGPTRPASSGCRCPFRRNSNGEPRATLDRKPIVNSR